MSGLGGAERACGKRVKGGIYIEVPLAPPGHGKPMEDFLFDPPMAIPEEWHVSAIGVTLIPDPDEYQALVEGGMDPAKAWDSTRTCHVVDLVGQESYPNVADVLEEGRYLGFSRRLPSSTDFSRLTERSRLLLGHARGIINDPREHRFRGAVPDCPKIDSSHIDRYIYPVGSQGPSFMADLNDAMCVGLWWWDLDPATTTAMSETAPVKASRSLPSVMYFGHNRPAGYTAGYTAALIANLPLARIAVVSDPDGGSHLKNLDKVAASDGVPISLEDE